MTCHSGVFLPLAEFKDEFSLHAATIRLYGSVHIVSYTHTANHAQLHAHPSNLLLGHDDNLFYNKTMHRHSPHSLPPQSGSFFFINRRNYRKFSGKDDTSHCGVVAKWLALLQGRLRRFDSWPGAFGGLFAELQR